MLVWLVFDCSVVFNSRRYIFLAEVVFFEPDVKDLRMFNTVIIILM